MAVTRSWAAYQPTYRTREMEVLAGWILAGASGSVVGLAGAGKSNLLGFLCHRPEVLQSYLPCEAGPVALIPVDLNNLPAHNLSTLYRVILRAFHEARGQFDPEVGKRIAELYLENRAERDPFLSQSALRELLLLFQSQNVRVVLVLDRFDKFCELATPRMTDTLRGLRDSFKDTVCYIVGARQEIAYLSDPAALGELYELLDSRVCWVGPMSEADARQLIAEETHLASVPASETEVAGLLTLTGGYPSLLKAACQWWLNTTDGPAMTEWTAALLAERSFRYRLGEIWQGLTQEERLVLSEVQKSEAQAGRPGGQKASDRALRGLDKQHRLTLRRLEAKGLCCREEGGWRVFCTLFARYVTDAAGQGRGRIWIDEKTRELYQGQTLLQGLAPLERSVLTFLVQHPRVRHTKTDLIENAWPEDVHREGVTDDSLYQVVSGLRKKIEPDPSQPCYIISCRGSSMHEGGYQFFPEGRPGAM